MFFQLNVKLDHIVDLIFNKIRKDDKQQKLFIIIQKINSFLFYNNRSFNNTSIYIQYIFPNESNEEYLNTTKYENTYHHRSISSCKLIPETKLKY